MMFPALVGGSLQETPRLGGWSNVTMTLDVFLYTIVRASHMFWRCWGAYCNQI